ncbi:acyl-CoA carboxylase subunit epsilon [Nocardia cyriacigeorgica]|uniref:acyl-CoA carboxylase epsilon subunit n=1 Tax=Nocardia cyriacigeorgica TaxID=135487 RepID=UPI0018958B78|nr:acyl-CoA carboxylase epsilon subunit [Nocardia cyriacigeorgica]MBF6090730.1 acyl-CoA carboxylase subunit epsilon [Nocardia cyriacigeorgica]MBF6101689.1 acyl-CoA carboxylase subunit epsilon [Nocardia cyriacigeorgica]MBF6395663.1 acyl-CoA carboxylase subunit epsilon [Nocardia cyriacigeorgica]MBF6401295.1 acyl-CoA carboxylase subunit epsilon [Nocardia cyriacigeorgica]
MTAIRIVAGNPTDAELAVLVLVLAAASTIEPPARSATPVPDTAWRTSRTARYRRSPAAWGPAPRQHRRPQPAS